MPEAIQAPVALHRVLARPLESDRATSTGMLVLRLVAGTAMALHGASKLPDPMGWMGTSDVPSVLQLLAVVAELGGGLAWIAGALTPLASLGIAFTMAVGVVLGHVATGDPLVRLTVAGVTNDSASVAFAGLPTWLARAGGHAIMGSGSSELALLYIALATILLCAGPGRFSIDALIARRLAARR